MNLVQDIYKLFEQPHTASEDNLDHFADRLKQVVRSSLADDHKRRGTIRMSNIGRPCDRQTWYSVNKPDSAEKMLPQVFIKFLYGHIIEELLLLLVREAGYSVTDEQKEYTLNGIRGHIDCKIDGTIFDVKSASSYSFRKFDDGTLVQDDPFGYIGQLSAYRQADGDDTTRPGFLVLDKTLGKLCTFQPEEQDYIDAASRIEHLKLVVQNDNPPERCFDPIPDGKSGNMKLNTTCSYCEFKQECWPTLRTFLYSNGPRFLVHVEYEPNVPEVVDEAS